MEKANQNTLVLTDQRSYLIKLKKIICNNSKRKLIEKEDEYIAT